MEQSRHRPNLGRNWRQHVRGEGGGNQRVPGEGRGSQHVRGEGGGNQRVPGEGRGSQHVRGEGGGNQRVPGEDMGSQQPNWRYPSSSDAEFLQNEREKTVHKRYDELMAVYKAGDKQRAKLLAQALLREERDLPRFIFSKTCLIIALVADDWQEAENFYQNALHSYEMALGVVKRNGAYGACEHIRDIYDALDKHLKRFGPVHAARKPGEGREAAITAGPRVISAPQDSDEEL